MATKPRELNTPPAEDSSSGDSLDRRAGAPRPSIVQASSLGDPDWLGLARNNYLDATEYLDSSLRAQWERNERAFRNQHPPGSKYNSASYRSRSRIFRPKTRSMIRGAEAQAATAFFSNEDVVSTTAVDDRDPAARANAELIKHLLQHRLTSQDPGVGVPWFITLIGALQLAQKLGVVVSKQWWEYRENAMTREDPMFDPDGNPVLDEDGVPIFTRTTLRETTVDRPRVDLFPLEQVRIAKGASWVDPINSSPFLILMHWMYIDEIEQRMDEHTDPKTSSLAFHRVDRSILLASSKRNSWDSTRHVREGQREDSKESDTITPEYQGTWAHENFMRWKGRDFVYYTSGIEAMLSDVRPTEEVYAHCKNGERPVVMGLGVIEALRTYPAGKPELVQTLQAEANDLANLRIDNVKLSVLQRWLARRGRQVDLRSLMRATPGSITLVTDVESDVKMLETKDVTSSSFQEQDRLNLDFDDMAGSFNPGSIQSNRRLNETVGGLKLLSGTANLIGEFDMRVFVETWVEPALRQVSNMERIYETDINVLAIAGAAGRIFERFGVSEITDRLLENDVRLRVNVGIGATDPAQKLQRLDMGFTLAGKIFGPSIRTLLNGEEVLKEVFGPLGYRDGARFFNIRDKNPTVQMLLQEMQALNEELEKRQLDHKSKEEVARIRAMAGVVEALIKTQSQAQQQQRQIQAQGVSEERKARHDMARTQFDLAVQDQLDQRGSMQDLLMQMMQQISDENLAEIQAQSRPTPSA